MVQIQNKCLAGVSRGKYIFVVIRFLIYENTEEVESVRLILSFEYVHNCVSQFSLSDVILLSGE